ncbi:hypothetical protein GCM10009836_43810 [Pseudonocardia ailaonensis]|uniref:Periplasmic binding protein domain-containing protein n=1 Tax=Pseudonocardia ailaonensis TaxID=367279 RepID=A0ABN2NA31_9PSEU
MASGSVPSMMVSANEQAKAAAAIGWTHQTIAYDGTVTDANAKLEQAIAERPTVVAIAGVPPAAMQQPIASAQAAGVVLSLSGVTEAPSTFPGYAAASQGPDTQEAAGERNAYLALKASGCNANVLVLSAPVQTLKPTTDKFQSVLKQLCPQCKSSYSEIQFADIGSPAATSKAVSALQVDPSIKYVYAAFANLVNGLQSALDQAGIDGVTVFGTTPDVQAMAALKSSKNPGWWVTVSAELDGWFTVDAALRALDKKGPVFTGAYPVGVLTKANAPASSDDIPSFPTNFRELLTTLWTPAV